MTKNYAVIYEQGDANWSAFVPDLPGCVATGATREQTEQEIRSAIEFHIEGLQLHGDPIPEPNAELGIVEVSV